MTETELQSPPNIPIYQVIKVVVRVCNNQVILCDNILFKCLGLANLIHLEPIINTHKLMNVVCALSRHRKWIKAICKYEVVKESNKWMCCRTRCRTCATQQTSNCSNWWSGPSTFHTSPLCLQTTKSCCYGQVSPYHILLFHLLNIHLKKVQQEMTAS